jgi:hypothetical protein
MVNEPKPVSIFSKPLTERTGFTQPIKPRSPKKIFRETQPIPTIIKVATDEAAIERPKKVGRPSNDEVLIRQKAARLVENANKLKVMDETGKPQLFRGQRVQMVGPGGTVYRGEVDNAPVSMPEFARVRWENGAIQWHAVSNLKVTSGPLVFQALNLSDLESDD